MALELPEPVRSALAAWRDGVIATDPALRPVRTESLHATLCFLGGADPVAAARAVGPVVGPVATLAVGPARRRARVVAVALEDASDSLAALRARVAVALAVAVGYADDHPGFWAHVTVARARSGAGGRLDGRRHAPLPDPPRVEFRPESVALYRSHLGPGGSRYEALARWDVAA